MIDISGYFPAILPIRYVNKEGNLESTNASRDFPVKVIDSQIPITRTDPAFDPVVFGCLFDEGGYLL